MADFSPISGTLDTNIPLRAGAQQAHQENPMAMAGQMMQLQSMQNRNALFPGEQQLQRQAIQQGQQSIQNNAIALNAAKMRAAFGGFGAIINKPSMSIDDVTSALAGMQANGQDTTAALLDMHANMDPANPGAFVRSRFMASQLSGPEQVSVGVGTPAEQDQGGQLLSGVRAGVLAPNAGSFAPSSATQRTLSPESATAPTDIGVVPLFDPQTGKRNSNAGANIKGTRQQFIDAAQGGDASPLGTGRLPAALRGPHAPPPPAPGIVTSLSPSQASAATETGAASAKAFQDIADQSVQSRNQVATLSNMLGDTTQFATGPGADAIARIREIGGRLGLPVDKDATSAAESFNKLAAQIASQQGAGSDARLAVAANANPHSSLSPDGVDMILRQLQGNADYLGARAKVADGYPNKDDRSGFENKIGSNLDPRVFQYARMTAEQKGAFFKSMKDQEKFIKKYKYATDNGLFGVQ